MPVFHDRSHPLIVIAGLDPAIHRAGAQSGRRQDWMPGSSPGMTVGVVFLLNGSIG